MKVAKQVLAVLVIVGFPISALQAQSSDHLHTILGIEVEEGEGTTMVTVEGTEGPTFSVYRLQRPPRIFVDFSNSELGGDITNWTIRNGLVEDVLALQYREDHSLVTRVIITLQLDEFDYDIDTNGANVIVLISGEPLLIPTTVAEDQSDPDEVDALRRAAADAETRTEEVLGQYEQALHSIQGYQEELAGQQEELVRIEDESEQWRDEVSRLQQELSDLRAQVDERDLATNSATELDQELSEQLRLAEENLSEANTERESALERAADSQAQIEAIQSEVARLESDASINESTIEERAEQLRRLEEQATETAEGEELQREISNDLADRLAELSVELIDARNNEDTAQDALDQLVQRYQTLETELLDLENLEGGRDALLEESEELEERRSELVTEMADVQTDLTDLEDEVNDAAELRQRFETEANEAEVARNEAESALAEATQAREAAERATATARLELEQTEHLLEQRRSEQETLVEELGAALDSRDSLQEQLAELTTNQLLQQQQLLDAQTERAEIEAEVARLAEIRAETERELEEAEQERIQSEQELAELAQQRESVAEALADVEQTHEAMTQVISELVAERDEAELLLAELAEERDSATSELHNIEETRDAVSGELAQLSAEQTEIADQVAEALAQREQAESELAELGRDHERLADELTEMEAAIQEREEAESELTELARRRDEIFSEINEMQELLDDLEAQAESAESQVVSASYGLEPEDSSSPEQVAEEPTDSDDDSVEIVAVRFEQTDGVDRIVIEFSSEAPDIQSLAWDDGRAGLVIENAQLPDHLMRTLDTRAFNGPVNFVSSFLDEDDTVRVVAEISSAASEILTSNDATVSWEFTGVAVEEDPAEYLADDFEGYNAQEETPSAPPISRPDLGRRFTIGSAPHQLETPDLARDLRVTIDLVNADVQNILRLFSDEGDVNIIASGDVAGNVTLRLLDVPLDLAFALILQSQGLGWQQRGNIIRVAPQATFDEERRRALAQIAEEFDVEPLQVRLRPVSYADPGSMQNIVQSVMSSRGSATYDDRTHTLILTDVPENLDAAEQLIDALDTQTPQILIEARIVQTGESLTRGFGIQWGGDALMSPANGNATGLLFPSSIGIAGGAGSSPNTGTSSQPNYAVNVPGPGTGAIGFQFGSLGQAVNLNLRLSAAEATGTATVVSAPRILTLDGQSASISSGLSIPVQSVSAAGTNITFVNASLSLTVTPTVSPDGFILLNVNVNKNEPDFGRTGANGDPTIVTRTASTNLLVRDGETSVIGGIFEHVTGTSQTAVPFFADIPILGALFHNYQFQDERNETLVFITPRIVNRDVSLMNYTPGDVLMTPPTE